MQGVLAYQVPWHWLAVVIWHTIVPGVQQAPRLGGQLVSVHGTPAPSHVRPCWMQSSCVVTAQWPVLRLQHPPRGHGFGVHEPPGNHFPLHCVELAIGTHTPSSVQQTPLILGHGFVGVHAMLENQCPQQQASVVTLQPAGSVGQGLPGPFVVVVMPLLVQGTGTQQAPSGGHSVVVHG